MLPPILPPPFFFVNPATFAAGIRAVGGAGASTLLAYVLVQHLWKHTPEWIREDGSWQALFARTSTTLHAGEKNDAESIIMVGEFADEMATLTAVVKKLEALVIAGYDKLGSRRGLRRRRRVVRRAVDSLRRKDHVSNETETVAPSNTNAIENNAEEQEIISPLEWHAALLAYWQLSNQIRKRFPSWRDEVYARCCGHPHTLGQNSDSTQHSSRNHDSSTNHTMNLNSIIGSHYNIGNKNDGYNYDNNIITSSQIKELQSMLQFAIWAYESNEELLRSFLLSGMIDHDDGIVDSNRGSSNKEIDIDTTNTTTTTTTRNNYGYQLIVHRTTSYMEPIAANPTVATNSSSSSLSKKMRKPPGRVGYFVAVSHVQRTLLIGLKGTSTLEELLTDCCGRAVRVDLDNAPHGYFPTLTPTLSVADETDQGADKTVNDNTDPSLQSDVSLEQTINEEHDPETSQHGKSNVEYEECDNVIDEDFLHVTGAGVLPDESIEVELLHHGRRKNHHTNASVVISLDDTTGKRRRGNPLDRSSKSKTSLRGVSSADNVLLFPSAPVSSSTRNINVRIPPSIATSVQSSTLELDHSPTDEFMESNGVEMEENRSHKLRGVHEGILHCAQQLFFEISPLIEEYALSKGYDVVCTGHSLGAGAAILLAVLVRGRYPELTGLSSGGVYQDVQTRCDESGLNRGERVRAYAFAPPPVLDRESSLACRHYVTSVVNGSDLIPRSSLTNLDAFLTILEAVRGRLVETGMNPGSTKAARQQATNVIASTIALFCKLCEGTEGDLLLDPIELRLVSEEAIVEACIGDGEEDKFYWDEEFGHHLFVPGRVLLMYEAWSPTITTEVATKEATSGEANPTLSSTTLSNAKYVSDKEGQCKGGNFHAMWTDGTNSGLKRFEIGEGSGMVTDHLTTSYQRSLERCLSQMLDHDQ